MLRAALAAVAAGGAGHHLRKRRHDLVVQELHLLVGQRLVVREGLEVVGKLVGIGHAAEHDVHVRQRLEIAERPCGYAVVRTHRAHLALQVFAEVSELAAAAGLHYYHRKPALGYHLVLLLRVLKRPVEIVELYLHKLEAVLPVEYLLQSGRSAVRRESEVAYLALLLHLDEILGQLERRVGVDVIVALHYAVQQIEVDIVHAELFELFGKGGCDLLLRPASDRRVQPGELGRDVICIVPMPSMEILCPNVCLYIILFLPSRRFSRLFYILTVGVCSKSSLFSSYRKLFYLIRNIPPPFSHH